MLEINNEEIDIQEILNDEELDTTQSIDEMIDKIVENQNTDEEEEESTEKSEKKVPEVKTDNKYSELSKDELIAQIVNRDKRISDKDSYIGKRSSEIGDLKKQVSGLIAEKNSLVDPSEDEAIENPIKAMKQIQKNEKKRTEIENDLRQLTGQERINNNINTLRNVMGTDYDYDTNVKIAIKLLEEDGAPVKTINDFRNNPGVLDTAVTFNILKRAEAEIKIADLEAKLEKLSKSKKNVIKSFDKIGKTNLSDIPATGTKDYNSIDVDNLSPDQIDKLLKKLN